MSALQMAVVDLLELPKFTPLMGLDLGESYMIGDKLIDLETGWNAGLKKSLLVRTGYGTGVEQNGVDSILKKAVVVDDIPEAVDWILKH